MTARRVGSPTEVKTTAARDVSSGDLHLCPDGRTGVYLGAQDVASGGDIVLHTCEKLVVTATAIAAANAGALVNFDFTSQAVVASGGSNIGRYVVDKANNATEATVLLNDPGPSA